MRIVIHRLYAALLGMLCVAVPVDAVFAQPPAAASARFAAQVADAKTAMLGDPPKALAQAQAAEATAATIDAPERSHAIATALWLQGEAQLQMSEPARAAPLIDRAILLAGKGGTTTKLNGDLMLSRGGLRTAVADVAGALDSYQQAHRIFQRVGETRSEAIAIISIGLLYQEAKDYEDALKYYRQSLGVYSGDPKLQFSVYSNQGVSLQELARLPQAQAEFQKALAIARTLHSASLEARTLRNIARGQLLAGKLDAADQSILLGTHAAQGDDGGFARNRFLVLSAWSAMARGHLGDADRLIGRYFALVDPATPTLELREGHEIAYQIYKKTGNQPAALQHLEALKQIDQKTYQLAASANTALAAAQFDFASQQLNIEKLKRRQLQRDIDDAKLRARTQLTVFGGLAAATLIIVVLLGFGLVTIRRSRNEVRDANIDLAKTNSALGKALAAKTEFLATTSHEIRTPLNGILGMTQVMLADSSLTEALRDRIGVVHGAGVTMRALVDDILDVAKMETGNLTIECVPFDLPATLREVSRLWQEQARGKGLGFTLDLAECPAFIEGDAARLRQIVFNLLSNALKFTEQGGVTVTAAQGGTSAAPTLELTVGDTGIGIAPDKLGIIFESFRQADAGTTRKFGGTGLGLAICQNLARAMDGDVTVDSVPGEGSRFTLRLPVVLATAPETISAPSEEAPGALLILDRNPIARAMLRAVLEPRAGTVVFAGSADDAVARIAEGGIVRVLIDDATLKAEPDLDVALRAVAGHTATTALLWPAPDDADRARFAAAGVDLVIAKPIAGAALAAALFAPATEDMLERHLVTRAA